MILSLLSLSLAATEEDLRAQVLAEQPRLAEEGLSDWETVKLLRRFAYDHSDTVTRVDSPLYSDQAGWPVADRYAYFDADQGGVICGGTGDALRLLYELWGYEAWYLAFGDPSAGGFTHVETLVAIEHDGERLVTVQDAQLDASYVDADGQPLDYLDLLAALAAQDHAAFSLEGGASTAHADTLVHADDLGSMTIEEMVSANWTSDPADYELVALPEGSTKIRSPRTLARFEAVIASWYGPFLEGRGLPAELPWLHLFPMTIAGTTGGAELYQQAVRAAEVGLVHEVTFEIDQGFTVADTDGTINQRYEQAGFDVQSWYYGGTSIQTCGDGQCLAAAPVDGFEGDYELMFEFQDHTWPRVELVAWSSVPGEDLRAAWYGEGGELLAVHISDHPDVGLHSAVRPVKYVILEAETGTVLVDKLRYGPLNDEVPVDTGDSGWIPDSFGDSQPDSEGPPDSSPDSSPEQDPGDSEPTPGVAEPTCGCRSGSASVLLGLLLLGWRRRR